MKSLPLKMKVFLYSLYFLTIYSLYLFISNGYVKVVNIDLINVLFFSLLIALSETFLVIFNDIAVSTGFSIQLASFLIFGPLQVIIIFLIGMAFSVVKKENKYYSILNKPIYKTAFNCCIVILSLLYANYFYVKVGLIVNNDLLKITVFVIIYYLVDTIIISILYSILSNKNLLYTFIGYFKLSFLNILAMAPFGVIIEFIFGEYKHIGVILALSPLVLARYTFSLYLQSRDQYTQTVNVLSHAIEARDIYTEGHSERVAELAIKIARKLRYNQWAIDKLNIAALLHDVGKIGIDDSILNKNGKLTNEEFDTIKRHPDIGYNILKDIKDIDDIAFIVKHHHERYDGKGYPDRFEAKDLNMDTFIIQLADSVDAMSTDRPYRQALSIEAIIKEVTVNSGLQFHPTVVNAYLKVVDEEQKAQNGADA